MDEQDKGEEKGEKKEEKKQKTDKEQKNKKKEKKQKKNKKQEKERFVIEKRGQEFQEKEKERCQAMSPREKFFKTLLELNQQADEMLRIREEEKKVDSREEEKNKSSPAWVGEEVWGFS